MSTFRSCLILFFALVAITASLVAWKDFQEIAVLRAAAMDPADAAALRSQARDAQARVRELEGQLAALRGGGGRTTPRIQGRGAAGPRGAGQVSANRRIPLGEILNNPEVQHLLAVRQKAQVDREYGALFNSLNLPPAQLDQLKGLLAEREATMTDVIATDMQQGGNMREVGQLVASSQAEVDGQIQAALGDAAYAQYQNFQQTLLFRNSINNLASGMNNTPTPLSGEQTSQFADAVSALAQTSFSAPQLQSMETMDEQNQIRQQLGQLQQIYRQTQPAAAAPK